MKMNNYERKIKNLSSAELEFAVIIVSANPILFGILGISGPSTFLYHFANLELVPKFSWRKLAIYLFIYLFMLYSPTAPSWIADTQAWNWLVITLWINLLRN